MLATSVLVAGSVTSCSMFVPEDTQVTYQPADGVNTTLGDLEVSNLLIVAANQASRGVLSAQVVNHGATSATMKISDSATGSQASVTVPSGQAVRLWGGHAGQKILANVGAPPGALVALQLSTAAAGVRTIKTPVLLDNRYYTTIAPSQGWSSSPHRTQFPPPTSSADRP